MKETFAITCLLILLTSCTNTSKQDQKNMNSKEDTIAVVKKDITGETAGSAYLLRATKYMIAQNRDTSQFNPIISMFKVDSALSLDLNLAYYQNTPGYSQMLEELELILKEVASDYNLARLTSIEIGRLILTGDLAVRLTKQYTELHDSEEITTANYATISAFLAQSELAADFNKLLKDYGIEVSSVRIEKTFFTTKDELLKNATLVTDTNLIPTRILDCITWLQLQAKP